jgi:hypothetical protein
MRMALDWDRGTKCYNVVRRLPLASVISPQFIRLRDDKSVSPIDVRMRQVTDLVEVPLADRDARQIALPASEILRREVYTKQMKGETMVRKFVLWKTNKETQSEDYPAYVIHFTDFSPNRKTALEREVRVSNSLEQINTLWEGLKGSNLAKGWEPRGIPAAVAPVLAAPVETPAVAATEPVAVGEDAPKMAPSERTTKRAKSKKAEEAETPAAAADTPAEEEAPKMAPSEREPKKPGRKKKSG